MSNVAEEVLEGIVEEAPAAGQQKSDAEARLAERTADLQRLQAEYANYRKRVDRDRAAVREQAVATVLTGLLPVLDAIDQAREHGELSGGFKSVADSLSSAVGKLGLVAYGEKGDPFDPKIHEALTHTYSPDVTEDTCVEIFQPGYKVGERILRPARVAVAEPATGPDGSSNEPAWSSDDEDGD
jgi:molecular chaperone GrpE